MLFAYRARSDYQSRRAIWFNVMGCRCQAIAVGNGSISITFRCGSESMLTPGSFGCGTGRHGPKAIRNAS